MPKVYNKEEKDLINLISEKKLYDQFMPAIKQLVQAGGSAEAVLAKSEPLAAATLVSLLKTADASTRRAAANDILNRVSGKPIERSMTVFADINRMAESELDKQISALFSTLNPNQLMASKKALPSKRQKRRSHKPPQIIIDAEVVTTKTEPEANG